MVIEMIIDMILKVVLVLIRNNNMEVLLYRIANAIASGDRDGKTMTNFCFQL